MSGNAEFLSEQRERSPYLIVGAATLLNMVSYVDRSCISVAAPSIGREFGLTPTRLGIVFSSFFLSYALLQTPWGAAADRIGPRKIVTFSILAWSACTALTGAALNYLMLVIVRVAFGGMEAALNPAIATALARWVPDSWRTTAFGIFIGGGRVGGAFAPAAAVFLLLRYGWRSTFCCHRGRRRCRCRSLAFRSSTQSSGESGVQDFRAGGSAVVVFSNDRIAHGRLRLHIHVAVLCNVVSHLSDRTAWLYA